MSSNYHEFATPTANPLVWTLTFTPIPGEEIIFDGESHLVGGVDYTLLGTTLTFVIVPTHTPEAWYPFSGFAGAYGYCSVAQVCKSFPQFQRGQVGSIQDSDIQDWIGQRKARIRSALLTRGFDPDAVVLSADQTGFLTALNADGVVADLGDALQGTVTLQPGEYSIAAARRSSFERVLKEITQGMHDRMFQASTARTQDVAPLIVAIGGAEMDVEETPTERGAFQFFGKAQVF